MIQIECRNERFSYDMYHIVKSFFPDASISQISDPEQESLIHIRIAGDSCFCYPEFVIYEEEIAGLMDKREQKRYINRKLYRMLSGLTGQEHAWGDMTGVRPTKMVMEKLEEGKSDQEIINFMKDTYEVSKKKARLGIEIAKREKAQLEKLDYENGYSLYIGIPFCPTTCSYCSFTSYPIARWEKRVDAYVDALLKEMSGIAKMSGGKKLNTIYMGGGTPTTLSAAQLERILSHLEENFPFDDLKEFTVEAGRPDSITQEKLTVLRRHPVDRISINPQTMQQRTLDAIGRRHTVEDVRKVFHLARELGFENINMDLIAGLPGEHPKDMEDTLRQIEELSPDSLTVHALAMKHGSRLTREKNQRRMEGNTEDKTENAQMARELEKMIDTAAEHAHKMGLVPYYLYRQKNIAGNFENVGYAKVDKAGIYNILIMEEVQTIIACGAGSVSKRVYPDGRIERCENVKDVSQYIERIGEMIERKRVLLED